MPGGGVARCPRLDCARGEYFRMKDAKRRIATSKPLAAAVAPSAGQSVKDWE